MRPTLAGNGPICLLLLLLLPQRAKGMFDEILKRAAAGCSRALPDAIYTPPRAPVYWNSSAISFASPLDALYYGCHIGEEEEVLFPPSSILAVYELSKSKRGAAEKKGRRRAIQPLITGSCVAKQEKKNETAREIAPDDFLPTIKNELKFSSTIITITTTTTTERDVIDNRLLPQYIEQFGIA